MATRKNLAASFDDFIKVWSGGSPLQIQSDVGWSALGSVEKHWPGLIAATLAEGVKGSTYAATLVDAGLVLEATKTSKGFTETLERLRSGQTSAFRELTVAALLSKAGLSVELEPLLDSKRPDISFAYGDQTVFIEVVTPNLSEFQKQINDSMTALAWYLYKRGRRNAVNVVFLDEPDPELLGYMVTIDEQVDKNPLYNVPYSLENRIEWIYSRPTPPTTSVLNRQSKTHQTDLFITLANPMTGAHIGVEYLLNEPRRLGRLIDQEVKHFSRETTNLLILDTKNNSLSAKDKAQVVMRRLQPNINRRLGGVLLLSELYTVHGIKLHREWELISNPYAYKPLSDSLKKFLSELGNYQLW
jgi:hypothetical protein